MIRTEQEYLDLLRQKQKLETACVEGHDGHTLRLAHLNYFAMQAQVAVMQRTLDNYDLATGAVLRKGNWIPTFTGRRFWIQDPRPGDFELRDIAHSLAYQCRWNGSVRTHFSVAQHLVMTSYECDPRYALLGGFHDVAEYVLGDVAKPVKRLIEGYAPLEEAIIIAAGKQYGFTMEGLKDVKRADEVMLATELRDLVPYSVLQTPVREKPLAQPIIPWPAEVAEREFLKRMSHLLGI